MPQITRLTYRNLRIRHFVAIWEFLSVNSFLALANEAPGWISDENCFLFSRTGNEGALIAYLSPGTFLMIVNDDSSLSYKIRIKGGTEGYVEKGCITKGFAQDLPPGASPLADHPKRLNRDQPPAVGNGNQQNNKKDETLPKSPQELAKILRASSVLILSSGAHGKSITLGSGFAVAPGLVATNSHVFPRGSTGAVIQINSDSEPVKITEALVRDVTNDLVLIRVPELTLSALPLSNKRPLPGDTVYVMGNPEGLYGTFSAGIVSALRTSEDRDLIQITAPISHGSSGGPVVNQFGEVIGVAVSTSAKGQNLNFAVPVLSLKALLDRVE